MPKEARHGLPRAPIRGRVVDECADIVGGVCVDGVDGQGQVVAWTKSSPNGEFELDAADGILSLRVRHSTRGHGSAAIPLSQDLVPQRIEVRLLLPPDMWCLEVRDAETGAPVELYDVAAIPAPSVQSNGSRVVQVHLGVDHAVRHLDGTALVPVVAPDMVFRVRSPGRSLAFGVLRSSDDGCRKRLVLVEPARLIAGVLQVNGSAAVGARLTARMFPPEDGWEDRGWLDFGDVPSCFTQEDVQSVCGSDGRFELAVTGGAAYWLVATDDSGLIGDFGFVQIGREPIKDLGTLRAVRGSSK